MNLQCTVHLWFSDSWLPQNAADGPNSSNDLDFTAMGISYAVTDDLTIGYSMSESEVGNDLYSRSYCNRCFLHIRWSYNRWFNESVDNVGSMHLQIEMVTSSISHLF